jgi:predicted transcriptional regulator|tara:strand:+ start:824 stop:1294 length:471 start_codon:yes stop_codon:yes gene_type:complete
MVKEIHVKIPDRDDFDEAFAGLIKIFLNTDTKLKIYLYLRKMGRSTSHQISKGANLYPSSVRETLKKMFKEGIVTRDKLKIEGAGKNPYEYEAISSKELTKRGITDMEKNLNKMFNLDKILQDGKRELSHSRIPLKIIIERKSDKNKTPNDLAKEK